MRTVTTYLDKDKNRTTQDKAWTIVTQVYNDAGNLQRTGYSIGAAQARAAEEAKAGSASTLSLKALDTGEALRFPKSPVRAGRDDSCELVISLKSEKKKIEKLHGEFRLVDGAWRITDRSKAGIWVNNQRLNPGEARPLAKNDVIDFAQRKKYQVM